MDSDYCVLKVMLSQKTEGDLTEQLSNIMLEKEMENKETQSFVDLPNEIIVAIIEEYNLTLEDRMNLRSTCKKMEAIVAECEFNCEFDASTLFIEKMPKGAENKYLTSISLLYDMADESTIPEGRHSSFIHLISRLFRRAHFEDIQLNNFDFRPDAPSNLMNVDQLLQLSDYFSCKYLRIDISRPYYDARIFDIITKLNPSDDLCLHAATSLSIDQDLLKNLPPVRTLRFKTSKSSFFLISDETILAFVAKHRFVSLGQRLVNVQPETVIEAAKIISTNGHMLLLNLRNEVVTEMLQIMEITNNGATLITSNPAITIHRKVNAITGFNKSIEYFDFTIGVYGTKITLFGMFTGVRNVDQEIVVEIGVKKVKD